MARQYLPSFFGRGDDPFGSLFREVQKTFEDFSQRTPFARFSSGMLSPKIDVAESKDSIEVTAELLGVDEKDLDVTLANGMLTVRGEKKTERDEQDKDKSWHVMELSYGAFSRAIPCRSIPTPRRSRRSLIRAYCTSTYQSRRRRQRSSKRSRSRKPEALQDLPPFVRAKPRPPTI
jgi:HSP20 family molecular chaperone IbpA